MREFSVCPSEWGVACFPTRVRANSFVLLHNYLGGGKLSLHPYCVDLGQDILWHAQCVISSIWGGGPRDGHQNLVAARFGEINLLLVTLVSTFLLFDCDRIQSK